MTEPTKAVFLSYAREDTKAARRIADALRAFGVEVWFDQAELRGGDSWDAKIKKQIRECALFMPVISAQTQERSEGYFRREWKLAVERTHDMAAGRAFIVPVVVDETAEADAAVPEEFMRVQWTRLVHGVPSPQFVEQVKRLLASPRKGAASGTMKSPNPAAVPPSGESRPRKASLIAVAFIAVLAVAAAAYFALRSVRPVVAVTAVESKPQGQSPAPIRAPEPDSKSIAVLPFTNMSADKENEFFADGVHEDVITNLTKIRELTVIARLSMLVYRGATARDLRQIGADLGVAHILTGSVRRAGNRVKINVQLVEARTGRNVWANDYGGDLTDVFALQASIAQEIATTLRASLTAGEKEQLAQRPTQNQAAYDLMVQARPIIEGFSVTPDLGQAERAISLLEQAVTLDPSFAVAYAQLARLHGLLYWFPQLDPSPRRLAKMKAAMDAAVRIAPDFVETRMAVGAFYYRGSQNYEKALAEFRAAELSRPNDADVLAWIALAERRLGHWSDAARDFERAAALNPRDLSNAISLVQTLQWMRRWATARETARRFLIFFPNDSTLQGLESSVQFELDGDVAAFRERGGRRAPAANDPYGLAKAFYEALAARDYPTVERILADPRAVTRNFGRAAQLGGLAPLDRAYVAALQGKSDDARRHAEAALDALRSGVWSPRQEGWAKVASAEADAYLGRASEAKREIDAAVAQIAARDQSELQGARRIRGEIFILLGMPEDALAQLRDLVGGTSEMGPNRLREDPLWSRLKADPRFEEILKSAKPL